MSAISNLHGHVLLASFTLFVYFYLILDASSYVRDRLGCDCGKGNYDVRKITRLRSTGPSLNRIVNGYEPNHRPWMAFLEICREGCGTCGGSILNHRWIASAAHCFCDKSESGIRGCKRVKSNGRKFLKVDFSYKDKVVAIVGLRDLATRRRHKDKEYKIKRIYIYPKYRPNDEKARNSHQHHDLALLKTERTIEFSKTDISFQDFGVAPICLPRNKRFIDKNSKRRTRWNREKETVYVAGWGRAADMACNTNELGPAPFTKCKFPFEYPEGMIHYDCLMSDTPSYLDKECQKLKRRKHLRNLPPDNYTRVDIKNHKNELITTCHKYLARKNGWCGTCIKSAMRPGERGYCQTTAEDPLPMANWDNKTGESIEEIQVLNNWGICSVGCRVPYSPETLQEAELILLEDTVCDSLLKQDLRFNRQKELCAWKRMNFKIRQYQRKYRSYSSLPDTESTLYGGVDACFGDSGKPH